MKNNIEQLDASNSRYKVATETATKILAGPGGPKALQEHRESFESDLAMYNQAMRVVARKCGVLSLLPGTADYHHSRVRAQSA